MHHQLLLYTIKMYVHLSLAILNEVDLHLDCAHTNNRFRNKTQQKEITKRTLPYMNLLTSDMINFTSFTVQTYAKVHLEHGCCEFI